MEPGEIKRARQSERKRATAGDGKENSKAATIVKHY